MGERKLLGLNEMVGEFMNALRVNKRAEITYTLDFDRKVGIAKIGDRKVETEYVGFTPLAREVRRRVEEEYGKLNLVGSIGFRGEVFENPRVYLRIEAGWGMLWFEAYLKRPE